MPNFFIVGAPKCGTTALAEWLTTHPQVFFSPVKEPNYFATDLSPRMVDKLDQYQRLFRRVKACHKTFGEGSVSYLYSREAVTNIVRSVDRPRFVVCLRNPSDMAVSLHGQQILNGNENITDFETAWRLCPERATGREAWHWCRHPELLDYASVCSLGTQLERLYAIVDPTQVHVIIYDDLKTDPRSVYRALLGFLGVDDDGRSEFSVVNAAAAHRSLLLKKSVMLAGMCKRRLGLTCGLGLLNMINFRNRKPRVRADMAPALRDELSAFFKPEVDKLSRLLGRDLCRWSQL